MFPIKLPKGLWGIFTENKNADLLCCEFTIGGCSLSGSESVVGSLGLRRGYPVHFTFIRQGDMGVWVIWEVIWQIVGVCGKSAVATGSLL